jgi:hypothetical protein
MTASAPTVVNPVAQSDRNTHDLGSPETGSPAGVWGRRGQWAAVVLGVVAAAVAVAVLTVPRSSDDRRLGPDNPKPEGSRAVVQVLRRQGVDVQLRTRSSAAVAETGARTTLLITDTTLLGPDQLERLADDDAADLVLVEPDEFTLSRLVPQIRSAGTARARSRPPGCSADAAAGAGAARAGGHLYRIGRDDVGAGGALCYRDPDGAGSYVVTDAGGRDVTVIGQSQLLTNQYFGQDGNAALALTSLGRLPELVWYTPDPLEGAVGRPQSTLTDLLPGWVRWVGLQLAVVALLAMVWRGRRLGRLVSEPLPVLVRAAETQEGRARLYRQASARGRAGATLRTRTLRRLAARLSAPSGTTPQQLVSLVATATGRDPVALSTLLLGPAPASDGALVDLADQLDLLENSLSASVGPDAAGPDTVRADPFRPGSARSDLKGSPQ